MAAAAARVNPPTLNRWKRYEVNGTTVLQGSKPEAGEPSRTRRHWNVPKSLLRGKQVSQRVSQTNLADMESEPEAEWLRL